MRVVRRVPEHLDENSPLQLIQQRQGFPPLGSQRIGLVEDGGDTALVFDRWQKNSVCFDIRRLINSAIK